jgi:hypothetical protein
LAARSAITDILPAPTVRYDFLKQSPRGFG